MRTVEALAIRIKDVEFNVRATKIHIRGEFSKTRVARDIYISDEATQTLRDWINWNYRNGKSKAADDLIFHHSLPWEEPNPRSLYSHIAYEFSELRKLAAFVERKDNSKRHIITLNSFRRFVDTTISDAAGKDYAEWFLGHAKSSYWVKKESEKREIYNARCMKHLTFLDYTALEAMGRSTEADLECARRSRRTSNPLRQYHYIAHRKQFQCWGKWAGVPKQIWSVQGVAGGLQIHSANIITLRIGNNFNAGGTNIIIPGGALSSVHTTSAPLNR